MTRQDQSTLLAVDIGARAHVCALINDQRFDLGTQANSLDALRAFLSSQLCGC